MQMVFILKSARQNRFLFVTCSSSSTSTSDTERSTVAGQYPTDPVYAVIKSLERSDLLQLVLVYTSKKAVHDLGSDSEHSK
jgi:hypothetical protein